MKLTLNNMMVQWIRDKIRNRGEDESPGLELVFAKSVELKRGMSIIIPLRKSAHVLMNTEVMGITDRLKREILLNSDRVFW